VLASALGLLTGLLALVAERIPTLEKVFATTASILLAFLAGAAGRPAGRIHLDRPQHGRAGFRGAPEGGPARYSLDRPRRHL